MKILFGQKTNQTKDTTTMDTTPRVYPVTVTMVVSLYIKAGSRSAAYEEAATIFGGTMSWQAWGEKSTNENLHGWVDSFPIITGIHVGNV